MYVCMDGWLRDENGKGTMGRGSGMGLSWWLFWEGKTQKHASWRTARHTSKYARGRYSLIV